MNSIRRASLRGLHLGSSDGAVVDKIFGRMGFRPNPRFFYSLFLTWSIFNGALVSTHEETFEGWKTDIARVAQPLHPVCLLSIVGLLQFNATSVACPKSYKFTSKDSTVHLEPLPVCCNNKACICLYFLFFKTVRLSSHLKSLVPGFLREPLTHFENLLSQNGACSCAHRSKSETEKEST